MKREQAEQAARRNRRVRHESWRKGEWLTYRDGLVVTEKYSRPGSVDIRWEVHPETGWRVLKPNRAELTAKLAEKDAELEQLKSVVTDGMAQIEARMSSTGQRIESLEVMAVEVDRLKAENEQLKNELGPAVRLADVMVSLRLKAEERLAAETERRECAERELQEFVSRWKQACDRADERAATIARLEGELAKLFTERNGWQWAKLEMET